jgi:hypothetical protein
MLFVLGYCLNVSWVHKVSAPSRMELSDEVSTGSGSNRVIVLTNSTVAWIEDPVATAPGTDCVIVVDERPTVRDADSV